MFGIFDKKSSASKSEGGTFDVEWREINGKQCLYFTFKGFFDERSSIALINKWKQLMKQKTSEKVCMICNCYDMENYDSLARINFQSTIKEFEKEIETFWILTENKTIRYGGMIMGMLLKFPLKVVTKLEDIK